MVPIIAHPMCFAKRPENRRTWGLLHPHPAEAEIVKVLLYLLERLNSKVLYQTLYYQGIDCIWPGTYKRSSVSRAAAASTS